MTRGAGRVGVTRHSVRRRVVLAALAPGLAVALLASVVIAVSTRAADLEEAQVFLLVMAVGMADDLDAELIEELSGAMQDGWSPDPDDPRVASMVASLEAARTSIVVAADSLYSDNKPILDRVLVDFRLIVPAGDGWDRAGAAGRVLLTRRDPGGAAFDLGASPPARRALESAVHESSLGEDGDTSRLTCFAPVRDSDGRTIALLAIDADQGYFTYIRIDAISSGVVLLLASGLLAMFAAWRTSRSIVDPMQRLRDGMLAVRGGNLNHVVEAPGRGDEFDTLIERFNEMRISLREHQRLREDITAAAAVQARLLPQSLPEHPDYEFAARLQYCQRAGGDAYDALSLDGRILFSVGDVTGHGIASALRMCTNRAALRTAWRRHRSDLSACLIAVNEHMIQETAPGAFMTLFVASLDPVAHELAWTNAGHGPVLIRRAATGDFEHLDSTDVPLGILSGRTFDQGVAPRLEPGDLVVVLTDGVTEARRGAKMLLGIDPVKRFLDVHHGDTMDAIVDGIAALAREWSGREVPEDDVTIMAVRRRAISDA